MWLPSFRNASRIINQILIKRTKELEQKELKNSSLLKINQWREAENILPALPFDMIYPLSPSWVRLSVSRNFFPKSVSMH